MKQLFVDQAMPLIAAQITEKSHAETAFLLVLGKSQNETSAAVTVERLMTRDRYR